MEYATHECADCCGLFPANHMVRVSDRVLAGESVTPQRWQENGVWHTGQKVTSHYNYQRKLICFECKRRRTRRAIMMFMLAAAAIVALLLFNAANPSESETRKMADSTTASAGTDSLAESSAEPPDLLAESDVATAANPEPTPAAPDEIATTTPVGVPSSSELSGAVAAALDTGRNVRWSAGDRSGEVLVSDPVEITDGTCRAVTVEGQTSTWCRNPGQDWSLR